MYKNPSLTWGGQYRNISQFAVPLHSKNGTFITHGVSQVKLQDPVLPNNHFIVRARVVDNKGCIGEDGNYTYIGKSHILFIPFSKNEIKVKCEIGSNYFFSLLRKETIASEIEIVLPI